MVTSKKSLNGAPLPVDTSRRYEPALKWGGILAWIIVSLELITVSDMSFSVTDGVALPKLSPVMVNILPCSSATALSISI